MTSIFPGKQNYMMSLILFLGLVLSPSLFAQGYSVKPVFDWVDKVQPFSGEGVDQRNNSEGVAYLLVDRQWNVSDSKKINYEHYSSKALNSTGVSEISQVSIDFDPVYESLTLHQVLVHRGNQIISKIDSSQINLIQREKDLEYQIYDGSKTLNILIDDVRPGDSVEYSYSIEGENPVFEGHFSQQLSMVWGVPVERLHYRVLWDSSRPLNIKNYLTDDVAQKNVTGSITEYVWQKDNIDELISDKDTPNWYDPYATIYLSDMAEWQDVVNWARPLYKPIVNTSALNDIIAPIMKGASHDEERILRALRFVQNEVRYLGIEMGVNSHKPSTPDLVLQRRFGDCKDKSRLLVSLLKGLGIQASFAFVDTYESKWVDSQLPTPSAFDHVIVMVKQGDENYWLDPTRNYQNGSLDTLYQPDYGHALVVSGQQSGPVEMFNGMTVHTKKVIENFDISGDVEQDVRYQIQTEYERYYADSMRDDLSNTSLKELQQSYLNYTAKYFPGVELVDKMVALDDSRLNKVTIEEFYKIKNLWQKDDSGRYLYAGFEPFLFNEHIKRVSAPVRTMPLAVTHPVKYQHISRIVMPADSSFDDEYIEIIDKAFRFTKKVSFSNNVLEIDYNYESLNDQVEVADIQSYVEKINEVIDLEYYEVSMPDPSINFGAYEYSSNDINWLIVIVTVLTLVGILYVSFRYIYLYDPLYQAPETINSKLEGLGGWLVLIGLSVLLTPVKLFIGTKELWYVFSAQQWAMLEDQIGAALMFVVTLEVMINVILFVVGIYLIFMFFNRRHTFPRFYIMYLIFSLVVLCVDTLTLHLFGYPIEMTDVRDLINLGLSAVIWGLYLKKSKRVKATFTRQRKHQPSTMIEPLSAS